MLAFLGREDGIVVIFGAQGRSHAPGEVVCECEESPEAWGEEGVVGDGSEGVVGGEVRENSMEEEERGVDFCEGAGRLDVKGEVEFGFCVGCGGEEESWCCVDFCVLVMTLW